MCRGRCQNGRAPCRGCVEVASIRHAWRPDGAALVRHPCREHAPRGAMERHPAHMASPSQLASIDVGIELSIVSRPSLAVCVFLKARKARKGTGSWMSSFLSDCSTTTARSASSSAALAGRLQSWRPHSTFRYDSFWNRARLCDLYKFTLSTEGRFSLKTRARGTRRRHGTMARTLHSLKGSAMPTSVRAAGYTCTCTCTPRTNSRRT